MRTCETANQRNRPIALAARRLAWIATLTTMVIAVGCQRQDRPTTTQPANAGITKVVDRGPIKLTVRVDKGEITIAEKLGLHIEVLADEGIAVTLPAFGDQLSEFKIRDYREWPAEPAGAGQQRWRQDYVLDILLSGQYKIPPVTVHYTIRDTKAASQPTANGPAQGELISPEIPIKIVSLRDGDADPTKFEDIAGPVELPRNADLRWALNLALFIAGISLLAGGVIAWRLFKRKRLAVARILSPLEWAIAQLDQLAAADLIGQGNIHDYYCRLADIVRQYIERQFHITAPEYTTEEFLDAMRDHPVFTEEHKRLLREFLRTADLVKFARYEPQRAEMERAMTAARDFVEHSRTPSDHSTKTAASVGGAT